MAIPESISSPFQTTTESRVTEDYTVKFQRRLVGKPSKSKDRRVIDNGFEDGSNGPRKAMLFIWQTPLMVFTYSVACFQAGLSSVVISPLAQEGGKWEDDAKTVIIYLVAVALGAGTFAVTSLGLYSGSEEEQEEGSEMGHIGSR